MPDLNLPILPELSACRSLLIAGMGGGFDVYCALPIYLTLKAHGVNVHLASLSFAQIDYVKNADRLAPDLVGVTAESRSPAFYLPEVHLARWFREHRGEEVTVWCFGAQGGVPLFAAYERLVSHLKVDGILLVDGGVDSLMRGDEAALGTIVEDTCSLAAVSRLGDVSLKMLTCVGFGTERDLAHAHALENIAALTADDAYLGACALVRRMEVCREYESAVEYAHAQGGQDTSVINACIVSAVRGHYGNYHLTERTCNSQLWISPLMPLYWFFDLAAVAEKSVLVPLLRGTNSYGDGLRAVAALRAGIPRRKPARIPLE